MDAELNLADGSPTARRISLHVVSPSAEAKRLSFPDVPLSTTIAEVKLKIQDVVPSRPPPGRQRLIYQGRPLVLPSATLETVFGPEASLASDTFTLHLVLPPPGRVENTARERSGVSWTAANTNGLGVGGSAPSAPGFHESSAPEAGTAGDGLPQPGNLGSALQGSAAGLPNPPLQPQHPQPVMQGYQPPRQPFSHMMGGGMQLGGQLVPHGLASAGSQNTSQLPQQGFGLPFPMNEHMRQAFANHLQHHEAAHRARSRNQNHAGIQGNHALQGDGNQATTTGYQAGPGVDGMTYSRSNGNTFVQEGQSPNGQWRVVVNQTTIPGNGYSNSSGSFQQPPATINSPASQTSTNASSGQPVHAYPPHTGLPLFPFNQLSHFFRPTFPSQQPFPSMVYLLSSPTGYQAVLVPSHATQGSHIPPPTGHRGEESVPMLGPNVPHDRDPEDLNEGRNADPQQQDEAIDILRIVFPLGGHLWLLIRLAGLVYLIAGGATWTRTILLSTLAFFVFIGQAGWLTPIYRQITEPLRRHLEGVIRADQPVPGPQQPPQQADRPPEVGRQDRPQPQERLAARPWNDLGVTAEQVAARLLRERDERNDSFLRATIRRFERSLALFIASLIPGVGEGHVAAQQEAEQAQRRREQEQEVERRRALEAGQPNEPADGTASEGRADNAGTSQEALTGGDSPNEGAEPDLPRVGVRQTVASL